MKILLVDDEVILLDSMKSIIDWTSYDLELVGTATSGDMALSICRNNEVDLVITDIKMRGMDGLELTTQLSIEFPNIKVIIMSSFDDFSYAKQAITLKVSNYLLKINTDKTELLNAIMDVKKEIELTHTHYEHLLSHDHLLEIETNRHIFLGLDQEFDQLKITGEDFVMLAICFDNDKLSVRNDLKRLVNLVQKFNTNICYTEYKNILYILTPLEHKEYRHIALRLKSQLSIQYSPCSIAVSRPHKLFDVAKAFREASNTIENRFYTGKNTTLLCESFKASRVTLPSYDLFLPYIASMNYAAIEEHFKEIFDDCMINYTYSRKQLTRLVDYILVSLAKKILTEEELNSFNDKIMTLEQKMYISDFCDKTWELLTELKVKNNYTHTSPLISKSIKYIMTNYNLPLSLQDVADYLNVSPAYLSRLFKKELGENITTYIQIIKIEHAKKLLLEDKYNIIEIANALGFDSSSYFTTIFQKHLSCSPSEYRKKMK